MSDLKIVPRAVEPLTALEGDDATSASPTITSSSTWRKSNEFALVRRVTAIALILLVAATTVSASVLATFQMESAPRLQEIEANLERARGLVAEAEGRVARFSAEADGARADAIAARVDRDGDGAVETQLLANLTTALTAAQLDVNTQRANLASLEAAAQQARSASEGWTTRWLIYFGAIACLATVIAISLAYVRAERRREWENRIALANLRHQERISRGDTAGFDALWRLNQGRLQEYHTIVVNHAASTRQTTRVIIVAGFGLLVGVSTFSLFAENVSSAISSSVAASAGALVTGFIARAVLRSSEASSRELLAFFDHPLRMERALTAERILQTMSDEARDKAKIELIRGLLHVQSEPALGAQNASERDGHTAVS